MTTDIDPTKTCDACDKLDDPSLNLGTLLRCSACPFAFHATCAGYSRRDPLPPDWKCWACAGGAAHWQHPKQPLNVNKETRRKLASGEPTADREGIVHVASDDILEIFYKAKAVACTKDTITVTWPDYPRAPRETLSLNDRRLWRGNMKKSTWAFDESDKSYRPKSRMFKYDERPEAERRKRKGDGGGGGGGGGRSKSPSKAKARKTASAATTSAASGQAGASKAPAAKKRKAPGGGAAATEAQEQPTASDGGTSKRARTDAKPAPVPAPRSAAPAPTATAGDKPPASLPPTLAQQQRQLAKAKQEKQAQPPKKASSEHSVGEIIDLTGESENEEVRAAEAAAAASPAAAAVPGKSSTEPVHVPSLPEDEVMEEEDAVGAGPSDAGQSRAPAAAATAAAAVEKGPSGDTGKAHAKAKAKARAAAPAAAAPTAAASAAAAPRMPTMTSITAGDLEILVPMDTGVATDAPAPILPTLPAPRPPVKPAAPRQPSGPLYTHFRASGISADARKLWTWHFYDARAEKWVPGFYNSCGGRADDGQKLEILSPVRGFVSAAVGGTELKEVSVSPKEMWSALMSQLTARDAVEAAGVAWRDAGDLPDLPRPKTSPFDMERAIEFYKGRASAQNDTTAAPAAAVAASAAAAAPRGPMYTHFQAANASGKSEDRLLWYFWDAGAKKWSPAATMIKERNPADASLPITVYSVRGFVSVSGPTLLEGPARPLDFWEWLISQLVGRKEAAAAGVQWPDAAALPKLDKPHETPCDKEHALKLVNASIGAAQADDGRGAAAAAVAAAPAVAVKATTKPPVSAGAKSRPPRAPSTASEAEAAAAPPAPAAKPSHRRKRIPRTSTPADLAFEASAAEALAFLASSRPLRLTAAAASLSPGDAVEIRWLDDAGMRGAWFPATILEISPFLSPTVQPYALYRVECSAMTTNRGGGDEIDDDERPVREWMPLAVPAPWGRGELAVQVRIPASNTAGGSTSSGTSGSVGGGGGGAQNRKRRQKHEAGDRVEVHWNGGWWPGTLTRTVGQQAQHASVAFDPPPEGEGDEDTYRMSDLRAAHPREYAWHGMLEAVEEQPVVKQKPAPVAMAVRATEGQPAPAAAQAADAAAGHMAQVQEIAGIQMALQTELDRKAEALAQREAAVAAREREVQEAAEKQKLQDLAIKKREQAVAVRLVGVEAREKTVVVLEKRHGSGTAAAAAAAPASVPAPAATHLPMLPVGTTTAHTAPAAAPAAPAAAPAPLRVVTHPATAPQGHVQQVQPAQQASAVDYDPSMSQFDPSWPPQPQLGTPWAVAPQQQQGVAAGVPRAAVGVPAATTGATVPAHALRGLLAGQGTGATQAAVLRGAAHPVPAPAAAPTAAAQNQQYAAAVWAQQQQQLQAQQAQHAAALLQAQQQQMAAQAQVPQAATQQAQFRQQVFTAVQSAFLHQQQQQGGYRPG